MTQYPLQNNQRGSLLTQRVQEAKARRQGILQRVRTERAAAAKKTVTAWMQEGVIIRASELKERYQRGKRVEASTERSEEK